MLAQQSSILRLVFADEENPSSLARSSCRLDDGRDHVLVRTIRDRVDRVEAKAVEVEFVNPVRGVVNCQGTHAVRVRAIVVEPGTPFGLGFTGVERGKRRCVVSRRPKVVVDDVEKDRQSKPMGVVHEMAQAVRGSIEVARSVPGDTVVSPTKGAVEFSHRHDFDAGNAKLLEKRKLGLGASPGSYR